MDGSSTNTSWYNTIDTSFSISTGAELAGLATIVNGTASGITADTFSGKTVTLTNDIDLGSNNSWTPIGNSASYYFAGTFDGGGHTISNLYYNNSAGSYVGLFGYLGTTGACAVKDVCLADVNISGNAYIGGICGYMNQGEIDYCGVTGSISASGGYVGGILGSGAGMSVNKSYAVATITSGANYAGGIAGALSNYAGIYTGYAAGTIMAGTNTYVGGIAGDAGSGGINSAVALQSSISAVRQMSGAWLEVVLAP
jgi:hypothetical protein